MKHHVFLEYFPEQRGIDTKICQLGNCSARSLVLGLHVLYESALAFLPSSVLDQMLNFHPSKDLCLSFLIFIAETMVLDFFLIAERHY